MLAPVWGSPLVADGKVYLGDEDGDVAVLKAGPELKKIAEIDMGDTVSRHARAGERRAVRDDPVQPLRDRRSRGGKTMSAAASAAVLTAVRRVHEEERHS